MKAFYLITIREFISGKILYRDVEGHPSRERAQLAAIETADLRVPNWGGIEVSLYEGNHDRFKRILPS